MLAEITFSAGQRPVVGWPPAGRREHQLPGCSPAGLAMLCGRMAASARPFAARAPSNREGHRFGV